MKKVVFAFADRDYEFNTSIHRCIIPAKALQDIGHDVSLCHTSEMGEIHADVVFVERQLYAPEVHYNIQRLKKEGAKAIATWDDAYHIMPDYIRSKPTWNKENVAKFRHCLKFVDCAIVPSEVLADDFRRYCKDIRVVKNYCDGELYQVSHETKLGQVRLFYGGNDTHYHSIIESGILPALQKVFDKYPKVVMYAVGSPMITNLFTSSLPEGRVATHGWIQFEEWPRFVAEHADIILAPLSGEYDRRRSCIKANDAAMFSLPMVATDLEPYRGTGVHLVPNDDKEWFRAISNLVFSDIARMTLGKKIHRTMGDCTMAGNIGKYKEIINVFES